MMEEVRVSAVAYMAMGEWVIGYVHEVVGHLSYIEMRMSRRPLKQQERRIQRTNKDKRKKEKDHRLNLFHFVKWIC